MSLTLLAVGGPRHGEQLPFTEGRRELRVPIMPDLRTASYDIGVYCVHGGMVRSRNDGDVHYVSASRVANLYGLLGSQWRQGPDIEDYGNLASHRWSRQCLGPDESGRYSRGDLWGPTDITIRQVTYVVRTVSDRAVYVCVG
jgi:hypothetical protein